MFYFVLLQLFLALMERYRTGKVHIICPNIDSLWMRGVIKTRDATMDNQFDDSSIWIVQRYGDLYVKSTHTSSGLLKGECFVYLMYLLHSEMGHFAVSHLS